MSAIAQTYEHIEIIVVDNNSYDGSISSVNQKFPEVITISNKNNVGFGAANNQGMEISNGEYILLINPDTLVREDTLKKTVNFFFRKNLFQWFSIKQRIATIKKCSNRHRWFNYICNHLSFITANAFMTNKKYDTVFRWFFKIF